MRKTYRLLFVLQAFVGVGGIAGGLTAILNPHKPLGVSVEILKSSPFDNFFIPGLILFSVIGIGSIVSALTIYFRLRFHGYISSIFSWGLVIWIVVQCIMINSIVFLHVLFFTIGLIEAILSTFIIFNQRLFPANLILNFYNKTKREI